jgi:signal transduction histidine kinase
MPAETASAGYVTGSVPRPADTPAAAPPLDTAGVLQHAHVIGQEIRRLDEVVQGFLKFSRPEEIKLRPVDVRSLLDDVMNVVGVEAAERQLRFQASCPPGLPPVNADAAMLRQALLNLALNACQAMQQGGTLMLGAQAAGPRHIEITVSDTGVGIPPEHLERIFDLYFTTKERGSGIGLSMVYRTIQLHDGTIEVESTPGRGTTFRILLPQA